MGSLLVAVVQKKPEQFGRHSPLRETLLLAAARDLVVVQIVEGVMVLGSCPRSGYYSIHS